MEARFSAFFHQMSSASRIFMPRAWMAKSIRVVVPPKAAARVPVSKSSLEVVPPKGMSRCVWTSIPPGSSSMPDASITRSAVSTGTEHAIQEGRIPGAVLLIGHNGQIVHRKAYGKRAQVPTPEPMTVDTIFDLASLTKVVATTSSLMKLFEEGKFRLNDRVTQYMPEFQDGKSDLTIRTLFPHFSGMPPDLILNPPWSGYQTGIHKAMIEKPNAPPGVHFVYSDINFILLGELVHRLSGQMLSDYAREHIFLPLGMRETMFQPPASLDPRIAPTERDGPHGAPLRGVVHDETSRYM